MKRLLVAFSIALGSVCIVKTADAEVTGSWLYDATGKTISDGNWTLNVQVNDTPNKLLKVGTNA